MKKTLNKSIKLIICSLFLFLVLIGSALAFSFRNMTLDFIDISDTHISVTRDDTTYKALKSSSKLLSDAIEQINSIKGLDFVLFNGDLVDTSVQENWDEYYKILKELKYPSLNCFGNHDFSTGNLDENEVIEIVKNNNPNYIFNKSYYAFSPKTDYRIIILDTIIKDIKTANGELSDEQLSFLDNEISSNPDKIIVIAMHHPSVEPFVSIDHNLKNADKFNEILLKYKNPIIVLTGHYHASKIRQIGNLVFVSTPSMVTYPMGFRHIKITNYKDRVQYDFQFLSTKLDDIKENNRQSVISYATLAGYEKDRDVSFTFHKKHPKSAKYKRDKIKKANKTAKTSKRELKKLSKPQALKVKPMKKRKFKKVKQAA